MLNIAMLMFLFLQKDLTYLHSLRVPTSAMLAIFSWVVFVLFSLTGGQQELSGGDYNSVESSE